MSEDPIRIDVATIRDLGYVLGTDMNGKTGRQPITSLAGAIDTFSLFQGMKVTANVQAIDLKGYYTAGDGGGHRKIRINEPSPIQAWHSQSGDGSWWQIASNEYDVRAFGVRRGVNTGYGPNNAVFLQNAINFRFAMGGGDVQIPIGFFYLADTLAVPCGVTLVGGSRHNILREYGDTTAGVSHINNGTVLYTSGSGTARVWTDESGTGTDTPIKPLIAILGENAGVRRMTVQTTLDNTAWDVGILVCGVSRGFYKELDVRGAWRKTAGRMDATWGRANANLMATTFLPYWFDSNYKILYDYGLTNNLFESCRFQGASAFQIESGPNEAMSTNGLSDTTFRSCEFYNDESSTTLATRQGINGALFRFRYAIAALGGAQGLSLDACRLDGASRWLIDIDNCSNLDIKTGREFGETSAAYLAIQQAAFPSNPELWRSRIRTTVNTTVNVGDAIRIDGELFANLSLANTVGGDNGGNVLPKSNVYREDVGKRIELEGPGFKTNSNVQYDGGYAVVGHILRSATGRIIFKDTRSGTENSFGFMAYDQTSFGTAYDTKWGPGPLSRQRNGVPFEFFDGVSFKLPTVLTRTTALSSNVYMDTTTGELMVSTSGEQYKYAIDDIDFEYTKKVVLESRPIYYRQKDDPRPEYSYWSFSAQEMEKVDPRLVDFRYGEFEHSRFIDVETLDGTVHHSWPAKYDDDDETKTLRVQTPEGDWIAFDPNDEFHGTHGWYSPRVESVYKPFEKPVPVNINPSMFVPHHTAMLQYFWKQNDELKARIAALEGKPTNG